METKNEELTTSNGKVGYSLKKFIHNLFLYVALILIGVAAAAFYFKTNGDNGSKIVVYRVGEVSVSLNEKSELVFINRDKGNPLIVDSTLTEVINNMLAARDYVRVNTIR